MSELFFHELGIPEPDLNLGVGSGSHAFQTAEIMRRFEPVVIEYEPDWVVVVGDVNSTIACSLVATKLGVRVAHVEAGLRSFDCSMPEEINRILTDAISDSLFVSERSGIENLRREGIEESKIHFVGNVMIDTLLNHRRHAEKSTILSELALEPEQYAIVTLHRPSNVDDPLTLGSILEGLIQVSKYIPLIFAAHPRTQNQLRASGLWQRVVSEAHIRIIDPLGYLDFLKLMSYSKAVLTDSGGMQEETTILKVPCLTLRINTERPVTVEQGTNQLVDPNARSIINAWRDLQEHGCPDATTPELWDGKAAERIISSLLGDLTP